jgi:tRNA(Ile2) C34 agmatinyltransferase TiaS
VRHVFSAILMFPFCPFVGMILDYTICVSISPWMPITQRLGTRQNSAVLLTKKFQSYSAAVQCLASRGKFPDENFRAAILNINAKAYIIRLSI